MKKIILAAALAAFSFTAHAEINNTCIDVNTSLTTMSESAVLESLIAPGCGMSMQDAVTAIINAGGDQQTTLTAALLVNPDFVFAASSDPTEGLNPTAAGGDLGGDTGSGGDISFNSTGGSSGGGGTVSP